MENAAHVELGNWHINIQMMVSKHSLFNVACLLYDVIHCFLQSAVPAFCCKFHSGDFIIRNEPGVAPSARTVHDVGTP